MAQVILTISLGKLIIISNNLSDASTMVVILILGYCISFIGKEKILEILDKSWVTGFLIVLLVIIFIILYLLWIFRLPVIQVEIIPQSAQQNCITIQNEEELEMTLIIYADIINRTNNTITLRGIETSSGNDSLLRINIELFDSEEELDNFKINENIATNQNLTYGGYPINIEPSTIRIPIGIEVEINLEDIDFLAEETSTTKNLTELIFRFSDRTTVNIAEIPLSSIDILNNTQDCSECCEPMSTATFTYTPTNTETFIPTQTETYTPSVIFTDTRVASQTFTPIPTPNFLATQIHQDSLQTQRSLEATQTAFAIPTATNTSSLANTLRLSPTMVANTPQQIIPTTVIPTDLETVVDDTSNDCSATVIDRTSSSINVVHLRPDSNILTQPIVPNETVLILEYDGGWYHINYGENYSGWVDSRYLTNIPENCDNL